MASKYHSDSTGFKKTTWDKIFILDKYIL